MRKAIVLTICTLLAVSLLNGCCLPGGLLAAGAQWTPTPPPADISIIIGEVARLKGVAVQVEKVEKSNGEMYDTPAQGNEYVIVYVRIKNISSTIMRCSSIDFQMKNSKGLIADTSTSMYDYEAQLNISALMPGAVAAGTVIFEQPKDDPELTLQYSDFLMLNGNKINVDLARTVTGFELLTRDPVKIENEQVVNLGDEGTIDNVEVKINKVQRFSEEGYDLLEEDTEYITVEVTVKNTGKLIHSYFSGDFMIRNSQGLLDYDTLVLSDTPGADELAGDNWLQEGKLVLGASATLTLSYVVKKNDADLALIYQPNDLTSRYLAFRIE